MRDPQISPEVALVAAQAARRAELKGQFTAGLVGLALIGILCSGPTLAGSAAGLLAATAGSLAGSLLVASAVRSRLRRRERPLGRLTSGATGRSDDAAVERPMTEPARWNPTAGEAIRVLRDPSSTSWEDAIYLGKVNDMNRLHRVRLPNFTKVLILPSSRIQRVAAP